MINWPSRAAKVISWPAQAARHTDGQRKHTAHENWAVYGALTPSTGHAPRQEQMKQRGKGLVGPFRPHAKMRGQTIYKTVMFDRVFALYRPCAYPGAGLRHVLARRVPEIRIRSSFKSLIPGSSKSRCSTKEAKPCLSKINSTLNMHM